MSKFEVVRGVEGCCLALDDTRIAGPKPWGGGTVIYAWETDKEYEVVDAHTTELEAENTKLRELVQDMFSYAFNREMELCNACVEANGEFADCAACDEYDGACGIAKRRFEELYADRIQELGMDVDV